MAVHAISTTRTPWTTSSRAAALVIIEDRSSRLRGYEGPLPLDDRDWSARIIYMTTGTIVHPEEPLKVDQRGPNPGFGFGFGLERGVGLTFMVSRIFLSPAGIGRFLHGFFRGRRPGR